MSEAAVQAANAVNHAQTALKTGSTTAAAAAVKSANNAARLGSSPAAAEAVKAAKIAVNSVMPDDSSRWSKFKRTLGKAYGKFGQRFMKPVRTLINTVKSFSFNRKKWATQRNALEAAREAKYQQNKTERHRQRNNALNQANPFRGVTRGTVARRKGLGFFSSQQKGSFLGKMQNRFRAIKWNPFAKSTGTTYKQRLNALQDAREGIWKGVKNEVMEEIRQKVQELGQKKIIDLSPKEERELQEDVRIIVKKINVLPKDERTVIKHFIEERYQPQLKIIKYGPNSKPYSRREFNDGDFARTHAIATILELILF